MLKDEKTAEDWLEKKSTDRARVVILSCLKQGTRHYHDLQHSYNLSKTFAPLGRELAARGYGADDIEMADKLYTLCARDHDLINLRVDGDIPQEALEVMSPFISYDRAQQKIALKKDIQDAAILYIMELWGFADGQDITGLRGLNEFLSAVLSLAICPELDEMEKIILGHLIHSSVHYPLKTAHDVDMGAVFSGGEAFDQDMVALLRVHFANCDMYEFLGDPLGHVVKYVIAEQCSDLSDPDALFVAVEDAIGFTAGLSQQLEEGCVLYSAYDGYPTQGSLQDMEGLSSQNLGVYRTALSILKAVHQGVAHPDIPKDQMEKLALVFSGGKDTYHQPMVLRAKDSLGG